MDDTHARDELRDDLIDALMVAEDYSFEAVERIVAEFERAVICPRCGSIIGKQPTHELAGPATSDTPIPYRPR